ncbi:preprotein translocase subunit YajC [Arthrobacter sp. HLT1-20]
MSFSSILAADAPAAPSLFSGTNILLFAMFGLLIFMMMRKQKKTKAAAAEQRSKLAPGVEMMTNFGLFGKVLSIDEDENKIVLEISPGVTATVHRQTVAKIIEPETVEAIVPDDASALTLDLEKKAPAGETVEESLERLKNDNKDN